MPTYTSHQSQSQQQQISGNSSKSQHQSHKSSHSYTTIDPPREPEINIKSKSVVPELPKKRASETRKRHHDSSHAGDIPQNHDGTGSNTPNRPEKQHAEARSPIHQSDVGNASEKH